MADSTGQGLPLDTPAAFDANNRIADSGWHYDTRGNVTGQTTGETFSYDAENRQTSFCTAGGGCTTYTYDGDGHRVMASGSAGTTTFVYDAAGALAAEYGPPSPSVSCVTCYVTTDHLGSTRVVTDQNGCAVFRQDYLAFGEVVLAGAGNPRLNAGGGAACPAVNGYIAGSPLRMQFTGQARDAESGLDYFGARYYSSAGGRFMSADEPFNDQDAADPRSWNLYGYVRNSPVVNVDPDGQNCVESSYFELLLQKTAPPAPPTAPPSAAPPTAPLGTVAIATGPPASPSMPNPPPAQNPIDAPTAVNPAVQVGFECDMAAG